MVEISLNQHGYHIEPYVHSHGSRGHGRYWGYVLSHVDYYETKIYVNLDETRTESPKTFFTSHLEALKFAKRFLSKKEISEHNYELVDIQEDPWIDIGGEG